MNIQTGSLTAEQETEVHVNQNFYFPTQIFSLEVPNAEALNTQLLKDINAERDRDQKGIQRSNFRSLGGWHSHNDLHKDERFADLVSHIEYGAANVSKSNGYHKGYQLKIGTMWSIINPPGSANRAHIHPGCNWSGVYYVQAPEKSGDIEFSDPRTQNLIMQPRYIPNKKRPKSCWSKVHFTPVPGKLLIFPSWLYHSVEPNLATEKGSAAERIIVSFNLSQKKTPKS